MNINCKFVIDKTNTIADVDGLYRDNACIHISGVTNILSFYMIEKRFRITYDNHGSGGNTFIVQITSGHDICFGQPKRGLYYYDPTHDTSRRGTIMVNEASPKMSPATTPLL